MARPQPRREPTKTIKYGEDPNQPKQTPYASGTIDKPTQGIPSAEEVRRAHTNADTDARLEAIHHTLGSGNTQASPGNHRHDGSDSALLLEGFTLAGSKTANPPTALLGSIVQALVRLGAKDATT